MKRLLKYLGILSGVLILLGVVASIALRIWLPPEKAKALIVQQLTSRLHREVKVGPVSVGVLTGLRVSDFKLSESPDFGHGTFISSDRFVLRVSLWPLLFKKILIKEVVLEHPVINVVRRADGKTYNFSNLLSPPAVPAQKEQSSAPMLLVSNARISDGSLHFVDQSPARQSLSVDAINLRLRNVSLTADFDFQASLKAQTQGLTGTLQLAGQANLLKDAFILKDSALSVGDTKLTAAGRVDKLTSGNPAVDLRLDVKALYPASFGALAALPPDLHVEGPIMGNVSLQGSPEKLDFSTLVDLTGVSLKYGESFSKPAKIPLRLSAAGTLLKEATAQLSKIEAVLSSVELKGNGTYSLKNAPMTLQLQSNTFSLEDLAGLAPAAAPYGLAGKASTAVRASGTLPNLAVNGSLSLQGVTARYEKSEISQLASAITFTRQDLSIPDLKGKLNGSDFSLKLTGHQLQTHPDIVLEASLTALDLNKILPPVGVKQSNVQSPMSKIVWFWTSDLGRWTVINMAWAAPPPTAPPPPINISGHVSVGQVTHALYQGQNLDLRWALSDVTPDLAKVHGTASLRQGPGRLQNLEELASLSKAARLALLPVITLQKMDRGGILKALGIPTLQSVPFDAILGDYVFRSGIMDIKTFHLTGRDLDMDTKGTIGLAGAQPLDVRVVMKLAPGAIGGTIGQLVTDESGRPSFAFTAKGSAANPQVKLDVREASKRAVQQVGQELLKGLLGGKTAQPEPAPSNTQESPQPAAPKNPVDDLQKTLKNIFN